MKINYVLIDFENVVPEHIDLLDQEWIRLFLFVGETQKKIPFPIVKAVQKMGARAEYISINGNGPNALDFHIAYYIGTISAKDSDAYFHIISKDQGFDPLVAHLKALDIGIDRVTSIEEIPVLKGTSNPLSKPQPETLSERIAIAKGNLLAENTTHPRSRKTLTNHVATIFYKQLSESEVEAIVEGLFADGCVRDTGTRLEYASKTSVTAK